MAKTKTIAKHAARVRFKLLVLTIEAKKQQIAKLRDELRALIDDVESVVDSLDQAEIDMDEGIRALRSGVDKMSEYV